MLNKDNAVTIGKNSTSISNSQEFQYNVHFQYGNKYFEAGLYSEAISEFVEVLKVFPNSLEVYEKICYCFLATNDFEHSIKFANEAIKISINSNNKALLDKFYSILGEAYSHDDFEKAIKYYKLALDENKDDNSSFLLYNNYKIGECYSLKDFLEKSNPDHLNLKQAILYYEKALKIDSKHFESTYSLGYCYFSLKEYKKAIDYYEKALKIDSNHYESTYGLGNCYRNLKEYKKAIDYYEKALKQEPNNFLIKWDLEDCKKQLRKK
jgi:tetratricopeptide (TPR) repeat protein